MVLGLSSNHNKGASVKVGYTVHVKKISPWPPSPSLRSLETLCLQWEYADKHKHKLSGSFISTAQAQHSVIEFNQSFKLPVILYQEKKDRHKFQKNYLEFSLFMPRKDKVKGQLLGTAIINFADYGVTENTVNIDALLNLKKGLSNNSVQSSLLISLEPDEKDNSSNSSPYVGLSKEPSLDNDNDQFEITSFTDDDDDDDASSRSSRTGQLATPATASPSQRQIDKTGYDNAVDDPEQTGNVLPSAIDVSTHKSIQMSGNVGPSVKYAEKNPENHVIRFSDSLGTTGNHIGDDSSFRKSYGRSMTSAKNNSKAPVIRSSVSSLSIQDTTKQLNPDVASSESVSCNSHEMVTVGNGYKTHQNTRWSAQEKLAGPEVMPANDYMKNASGSVSSQEKDLRLRDGEMNETHARLVNSVEKLEVEDGGLDDKPMEVIDHFPGKLSEDPPTRGQLTMISDETPMVPSSSSYARSQHAKSVHIHDPVKANGFQSDIYARGKTHDPYISDSSQEKGELGGIIEREEQKAELFKCESKWKTKIEMLEEELTEAAAIEVGLYSVVAEHASSRNKVHAPAQRLSRFYSNACKVGSQAKRSSAARATVSGLVVVSKSCGSDVPRLTFWLSNAIMLRSIISQTAAELPYSIEHQSKIKGTGGELKAIYSDKCADSALVEAAESKVDKESDDWEDISSFITALEMIESWLFSRIVESLWWQSFTPHMQPTVAKSTHNNFGRRKSFGNQEQGNFSTDLWKKAFKDACERLCPNRGAGHECGCLSALVRLVMDQLVNRLDVAMFNAILRESADEMPTDPLSDPICEPKVLPIPAGKSSFGAGVELKNVIGSWSRWLTDLFDLEDEPTECGGDIPGDGIKPKSCRSFQLLHALSDLMMLPFGMLADAPTRKEVCPMLGPTIIKRVLTRYDPDEFSPDPIPQNIIDDLDTEEAPDDSGYVLTSLPCTASPTKYSPPPAALLTCVGEVGKQVLQSSRLSMLKNSYNSDELDQLDSPFLTIVPDSFESSALAKLGLMPKHKGGKNVVRYQLLREMWKEDDQ